MNNKSGGCCFNNQHENVWYNMVIAISLFFIHECGMWKLKQLFSLLSQKCGITTKKNCEIVWMDFLWKISTCSSESSKCPVLNFFKKIVADKNHLSGPNVYVITMWNHKQTTHKNVLIWTLSNKWNCCCLDVSTIHINMCVIPHGHCGSTI